MVLPMCSASLALPFAMRLLAVPAVPHVPYEHHKDRCQQVAVVDVVRDEHRRDQEHDRHEQVGIHAEGRHPFQRLHEPVVLGTLEDLEERPRRFFLADEPGLHALQRVVVVGQDGGGDEKRQDECGRHALDAEDILEQRHPDRPYHQAD
jgi:hypothetical protein